MKSLLYILGRILSFFFPFTIYKKMRSAINYFYTGYRSCGFKMFGKGSVINYPLLLLVGEESISVGHDCYIGRYVQLTAWSKVHKEKFCPEITMGNNVSIGDGSQVTAINKIIIGNNVLTGKYVLITDNSHGSSEEDMMEIAPLYRSMISKGTVVIDDNVWIGEKASIMPNVHIGYGAIIAANAVVTNDIPPYSVAAGIPAKVIKTISK